MFGGIDIFSLNIECFYVLKHHRYPTNMYVIMLYVWANTNSFFNWICGTGGMTLLLRALAALRVVRGVTSHHSLQRFSSFWPPQTPPAPSVWVAEGSHKYTHTQNQLQKHSSKKAKKKKRTKPSQLVRVPDTHLTRLYGWLFCPGVHTHHIVWFKGNLTFTGNSTEHD